MKLFAIALCLCLVSQDGMCVVNRYLSYTCQPCTYSGPVLQPVSQLVNLSEEDLTLDCEDRYELIARMRGLNRSVNEARQHLLMEFDNDDFGTDRLYIATPTNLSWMEIIYNKLSFIYLNVKLIEMRRRCNVNINNYNIADRIPLCHVFGMMPHTAHFRDICVKEGRIPPGCLSFQIFAARVLKTAAHTFNEILLELPRRHCS